MLAVDEERQLELVALYGDDTTEDVTDQVEWTSSNPDVVEVDEDGRMVAKATGTAVISGSIDKRKFRVRLLVVEEKHPRRIEVAPAYVRLKEGQEKALVLTGTYEKGYQDLIAEDAEWTVEDPEIAEVIDGNIVARKAGKTIVTINYKGKTASVRVEVRKWRRVFERRRCQLYGWHFLTCEGQDRQAETGDCFSGKYAEANKEGATTMEPYVGEIRMFAGTYAPRGWAFARGNCFR